MAKLKFKVGNRFALAQLRCAPSRLAWPRMTGNQDRPSPFFPRLHKVLLGAVVGWLGVGILVPKDNGCHAQAPANLAKNNAEVAHDHWLAGRQAFLEGELKSATEHWESSLALMPTSRIGRPLESILVHGMLAETKYQLGQMDGALSHIDSVVGVLKKSGDWFSLVDWEAVAADVTAMDVPPHAWLNEVDKKHVTIPNGKRYPRRWWLQQVARANPGPDRKRGLGGNRGIGGAISVQGADVLAATAMAMYRRRIILGPLSKHSSSLVRLQSRLQPSDDPNARRFLAGIDAAFQFALGHDAKSLERCRQAAVVDGDVFTLSPILYLIEAQIHLDAGDPAASSRAAMHAAIAAEVMHQPERLSEAILLIAGTSERSMASDNRRWIQKISQSYLAKHRAVAITGMSAAAELSLNLDDASSADRLLQGAAGLLRRRDTTMPRVAAYHAMVSAQTAVRFGAGLDDPSVQRRLKSVLKFAQGEPAGTDDSLMASFSHEVAPTTPLLFQCHWIGASQSGPYANTDPPVSALDHLKMVMTPTSQDALWRRDRIDGWAWDCLGNPTYVIPELIDHLEQPRDDISGVDALTASDALAVARYWADMPWGGRLMKWRWMQARLGERGQRPGNEDRTDAKPEADVVLQRSAVGPPDLALPFPAFDPKNLGDEVALLTFAVARHQIVATLAFEGTVDTWKFERAGAEAKVARFLKSIGVNAKSPQTRIDGQERWKDVAESIGRSWLPNSVPTRLERAERLCIIPSGALWYFPFECLPWDDQGRQRWSDRFAISYSPCARLAAQPADRTPWDGKVTFINGRLLDPSNGDQNEQWTEQMVSSFPSARRSDSIAAIKAVPGPSAALVSLDICASEPAFWQSLESLSPIPARIYLPGFRSAVAGQGGLGDGKEIFGTLMRMRGLGVSEGMISRWPVGGESTATLMHEFLAERLHDQPGDAWRRSLQILSRTPLDSETEPLIRGRDRSAGPIRGDHPLFHSGYLRFGGGVGDSPTIPVRSSLNH